MCPAFVVGDRLGPGRHHWRSPDPMRPVAAFFVLISGVEASFDMSTSFVIPNTGQPVRIRATGSLQVRCGDPGLLIAQFVGLPFDAVNDGVLRSVSRSVERMLARLLTRRVIMAGTPMAVTDAGMMGSIVEELVAYNPTAGAVFGIELIRVGHLTIGADDGSTPYVQLPAHNIDWSGGVPRVKVVPPPIPNGNRAHAKTDAPPMRTPRDDIPLLETVRGRPPSPDAPMAPVTRAPSIPPMDSSPSASDPSMRAQDGAQGVVSGEIGSGARKPSAVTSDPLASISGQVRVRAINAAEIPSVHKANEIEVPESTEEATQPGVPTPVPGSVRLQTPVPGSVRLTTPVPGSMTANEHGSEESRGSIMGIGMSSIGAGSAAGEIPTKVAPGGRVLVPGPNGLMQSATVRQLLSGYYELEVGSSGETIWVPINGVVPE
ncbi:MAG: hypothetical protein H0T89_09325 [Deltaproteobacteria bacterium]|nr:hypothetical protein [Deltaproteobacteria bacterium]MDQ3295933.1 hypothetical protein [Myxococcota bacterium]